MEFQPLILPRQVFALLDSLNSVCMNGIYHDISWYNHYRPWSQSKNPAWSPDLTFAGDSRELPCDLVLRQVVSEPQPLHRWDLLRCGAGGHGCAGRGIFVGKVSGSDSAQNVGKIYILGSKKHHKMITWLKIFWWLFMATFILFYLEIKMWSEKLRVWPVCLEAKDWWFSVVFQTSLSGHPKGINEDVYIYIYVLRSFNFGRDRCWRW